MAQICFFNMKRNFLQVWLFFASTPEEDVHVQVLVQNRSICSEGCFYFMYLLKCANSRAKPWVAPHSWCCRGNIFLSFYFPITPPTPTLQIQTNLISSLTNVFYLNPLVTTAAFQLKLFHKIALFIILSAFLCKRRTNSEQLCVGLASRSLQNEICWFLFQWGERQLTG